MDLSNLTDKEFLEWDSNNYANWFSLDAIKYFETYLLEFKDKANLHYVQIGAYRGHASKWLMDNVLTHPTSTLTDIDIWIPFDEGIGDSEKDINEISERGYYVRMKPYKDQIKIIKKPSQAAHKELKDNFYDFIYVDADHTASAVLKDAINYWPKLKSGGIMAFDDYTWHLGKIHPLLAPKLGIDEFLVAAQNNFQLLTLSDQVWVRKN